MRNNNKNLIEDLKADIDSIQNALSVLEHSYRNCLSIGIKDTYSIDELDKLEAFTSRFARTVDMATQKIINSIMIFEKGEIGAMRDKAAFCEKNFLVHKAEDFINLRLTRNYIAHEYSKQDTNDVFEEVWGYYPKLIAFTQAIIEYCRKNIIGITN